MKANNLRCTMRDCRGGFTLLEMIISIFLVMVLSLGAMSYQFYAVKSAQLANTKNDATRIGMLLLENWKVRGGDENYDPTELDLEITKLKKQDIYLVTSNETPFYFTFSYDDVQTDELTGITLRELNLVVQWNAKPSESLPGASDPSLKLVSYVRLDQAGG